MIGPFVVSVLMLGSLTASSGAQAPAPHPTRNQLYRALLTGKVLDPDRALVHLSHTCNLRVDGQWLPVVDIQELVKGAVVPRGVNRIDILNSELNLVREIGSARERRLVCLDNRLYVWGDPAVDNVGPEGNVLTFANRGQKVAVNGRRCAFSKSPSVDPRGLSIGFFRRVVIRSSPVAVLYRSGFR